LLLSCQQHILGKKIYYDGRAKTGNYWSFYMNGTVTKPTGAEDWKAPSDIR